jgi:hypothetical protein
VAVAVDFIVEEELVTDKLEPQLPHPQALKETLEDLAHIAVLTRVAVEEEKVVLELHHPMEILQVLVEMEQRHQSVVHQHQ